MLKSLVVWCIIIVLVLVLGDSKSKSKSKSKKELKRVKEFKDKCEEKKCCHTRLDYEGKRNRKIICGTLKIDACTKNYKICDWDCNEKRRKKRKKKKRKKDKQSKKSRNDNNEERIRLQKREFVEFDAAVGKFSNYFEKKREIQLDKIDEKPDRSKTNKLRNSTLILERNKCGDVQKYEYNVLDVTDIYFRKPKYSNSRKQKEPKGKTNKGDGDADDDDDNDDNDNKKNRRRLPVHAPDDRRQVTYWNRYPWRANGLIKFDSEEGSYSCTGTLIGPNVVLTAGHCVYDNGGWFYNFKFYPGVVDIGDINDDNKWTDDSVATFASWANEQKIGSDFGWITLAPNDDGIDCGDAKGYLGFGYDNDLEPGTGFNTMGYPSDKPKGSKWRQFCEHDTMEDTTMLSTTCDSAPGQSGAPTYRYWSEGKVRIIYGVLHGGNEWYNFYPRITASKYGTICDYANTCD